MVYRLSRASPPSIHVRAKSDPPFEKIYKFAAAIPSETAGIFPEIAD
jgi:hypothetical protein